MLKTAAVKLLPSCQAMRLEQALILLLYMTLNMPHQPRLAEANNSRSC
jgi:hypothetical protein